MVESLFQKSFRALSSDSMQQLPDEILSKCGLAVLHSPVAYWFTQSEIPPIKKRRSGSGLSILQMNEKRILQSRLDALEQTRRHLDHLKSKKNVILPQLIEKWRLVCREALPRLRTHLGPVAIAIPRPSMEDDGLEQERECSQETSQETSQDEYYKVDATSHEPRDLTLQEMATILHIDISLIGNYNLDQDDFI